MQERKRVQSFLVFWVFQLFWLLKRFSSSQPLRLLYLLGILAFPWFHLNHPLQAGAFDFVNQASVIYQPYMAEIPSC